MDGDYDLFLVALSIGVAMLASFTALNLTGRLVVAGGGARRWWLFAAALALGGGIWSMHFVGMLAFVMPVPVTYELRLTAVSFVLPVAATVVGLHVICRLGARLVPVLVGGALVGLAVVTMHYTGMAAMRMPGVSVTYDHALVAISVAIAIVAATAALALAFHTDRTWQQFAASALMGLAIAGMHYTGMAAATFHMDGHVPMSADPTALQPGSLAVAVVGVTAIMLILALASASFDRKLARLAERESETLRRSEERYRSLIENASDIIAIVGPDGSFIYESSSAMNVLGYATSELLGKRLSEFAPPDRAADIDRFLASALARPGAETWSELPLLHSAGAWRDFEIIAKDLTAVPSIGGIVIHLRDITERKLMMAQLELLSETDLLTGLLNRRGFMKRAAREFERMRRAGGDIAVIMLDIDYFKAINDRFGHAAGDLVLAMIAEECRAQLRETDLLGRLGGEEFAIVIADGLAGTAEEVTNRLRHAVAAQRVSAIKGEVSVTASFGVTFVDPSIVEIDAALRLADGALYEAKRAGRNCIKISA